jgi:hypothetical protein
MVWRKSVGFRYGRMAVAGPSEWTYSEIGTLKERLNLLIN